MNAFIAFPIMIMYGGTCRSIVLYSQTLAYTWKKFSRKGALVRTILMLSQTHSGTKGWLVGKVSLSAEA